MPSAADTVVQSYCSCALAAAQHVYFSLQQLFRKQTSLFTSDTHYMKKLKFIYNNNGTYVYCIYYKL